MNLPLDLSQDLLKNKVIIVEDTVATPGRSIVLAQALNVPSVTVIATEFSPFTDWTEVENDASIGHLLEEIKDAKAKSSAVLLHSLTPVMYNNTVRNVVQFLNFVKSNDNFPTLIATIHGDCHPALDVQTLKNYADLWIKLNTLTFKQTTILKFHAKGKVECTDYDITIENNTLVKAVKSTKIDSAKVQTEDSTQAANPSSSFNLSLSEKEKEDGSKVELPFWKKEQKTGGEGKIEYIPDENDDWDDEDPDDDLDI